VSVVWLNGAFTDGSLKLDAHDRGFLLGDGVFETIAVINHKPLWLTQHLERMEAAAAELGIPFDSAMSRSGVAAVVEKSQSKLEVMRLTLSRGVTARGRLRAQPSRDARRICHEEPVSALPAQGFDDPAQ
jgi:branched-chain amino acid aminotransferase